MAFEEKIAALVQRLPKDCRSSSNGGSYQERLGGARKLFRRRQHKRFGRGRSGSGSGEPTLVGEGVAMNESSAIASDYVPSEQLAAIENGGSCYG
jgi:hypothetical protein